MKTNMLGWLPLRRPRIAYPHLALPASCALCLLGSAPSGFADLLTSTNSGGSDWNTANTYYWYNAGVYVPGLPVAGNTYQMSANTVAVGNNVANARIRNPTAAGIQTFPGAALILNTNTELRVKGTGAFGTTANFPGVNGNAGLVLYGGTLTTGDTLGENVAGTIEIRAGAQSYFSPGNNLGGGVQLGRAINLTGQVIGSGTLVMFEGGAPTSPTVPVVANSGSLQISGNSNTFSGTWVLKAGWLKASGANALGVNSTVVVDPQFTLPVPPLNANIVNVAGPAILEISQDFNAGGSLMLTNGGVLYLHTHCCFSSVTIEGTPLASGTYTYAQLAASYPGNFSQEGDGTLQAALGTLTVQPYGPPPQFPPTIASQPSPVGVLTNRTAHFNVIASGAFQQPATFQWLQNGVPLGNTARISGSTTASLTISNVVAADAANYSVVVTASGLSTTSSVAGLVVSTPSGYEAAVLQDNPVALYTFNENMDPSTGTAPAFDVLGNYNGTYVGNVQNGYGGIVGPQATLDGLPGFPDNNLAFANSSGGGDVSIPGWILNTNTVTIALWINPSANPANSAGLVMCRGSQVGGICFGNNVTNGVYPLGINWNNEAASYNWNSGLTVPLNLWSLVAMAVSPTNTILYLINTNGLSSATITRNNVVVSFNGTIQIGNDTGGGTGRGFGGSIDDVAVFNTTLSQAQLLNLYGSASGINYFPVSITAQPLPQTFFSTGGVAHFSVAASGSAPLTYQWYFGANPLTNSSRISGATNTTLTISSISTADLGNYHVVVANLAGSVASSNALLSVQAPSGDPYEAGVLALSPMAFYELNETGDPAAGNTLAFDYAGGYNGLYGTAVQNGNPNYDIQGPQPGSGFPGFAANNTAAHFEHAAGSQITLPPFNLNTNNPVAVTMAAWIYPSASEPSNAGLVFSRANGSVCGLDYSSATDASANRTLGYMWNITDPRGVLHNYQQFSTFICISQHTKAH